jgi:hypothetical protein
MYSVIYECYPELVSREKARAREREEPMSPSVTADGPWPHSLQRENQLPTGQLAYFSSPAYLEQKRINSAQMVNHLAIYAKGKLYKF